MESPATRTLTFAGTLGIMLLMVGCTSTTRVSFSGPTGTVLYVDDKSYHLPAIVEFTRPAGSTGSTRHDAGLVFTSGHSQEVRATGYLEAFGFSESEVDKLATNTCILDEPNLLKIQDGATVIFKGQSASRQPLYDLVLRQK